MTRKKEDDELLKVVRTGTLDDVRGCLTKHPDVNCSNESGNLPIHLATWRDGVDVLELLLNRSHARINSGGSEGMRPLHYAVTKGNLGAIKLLLAYGADVNAANDSGDTPLHVAAAIGSVDAAKILLNAGADIDKRNLSYGSTPLIRAVASDKEEMVKFLISKDADVRIEDNIGRTAKTIAVKQHRWAASHMLEKAGMKSDQLQP